MAKSTDREIAKLVLALAEALADTHGDEINRITVYPATTGKHPYQVELRNETWPLGFEASRDGDTE